MFGQGALTRLATVTVELLWLNPRDLGVTDICSRPYILYVFF